VSWVNYFDILDRLLYFFISNLLEMLVILCDIFECIRPELGTIFVIIYWQDSCNNSMPILFIGILNNHH